MFDAGIAIKTNIKTWVNGYRMVNDTVDILDPFIINVGIDFVISPSVGEDRNELLAKAISTLAAKFKESFFIGEPLYISHIYKELKTVTGIMDVLKVRIRNKTGGQYSSVSFDINKNLSSLPCNLSVIYKFRFYYLFVVIYY